MKKILCIDGGGVKGAFPASFLATIEEQVGGSVADYFDLIVGTSTGGIIALGLGLGLSAREVLGFYEDWGPRIFARPRRTSIWGLARSLYDNDVLLQALQSVFGERRLGDSRVRLVIPSLNLQTGEVHLYKTAHHPRFELDYKVPVVEIACATSAAPTYFPTFRSTAGVPHVDGGVWANNPIAVAAVEALTILDWHAGDVRILSLGCTRTPLDVGIGRRVALGRGYWAFKMVDVFMTAQSQSALGMAQHLLGKEYIVRIDPQLAKGKAGLNDISCIPDLVGLGQSEARAALPSLRNDIVNDPAQLFEPIHHL
jgi:hypothetical protein